jgi:DNA-binding GntR family transcriptional regulator
MRGALETLALRLAIPELTNRQLEDAGAVLDRAERADLSDFGVLNKEFHTTLYAPCRRPRLLAQIATLDDLADRYLRVAAMQLDYIERSHREHRALLQACYDRDADAAVACLRDHIESAGRALYGMLAERLGTA